jgi:hypothetical protein
MHVNGEIVGSTIADKEGDKVMYTRRGTHVGISLFIGKMKIAENKE